MILRLAVCYEYDQDQRTALVETGLRNNAAEADGGVAPLISKWQKGARRLTRACTGRASNHGLQRMTSRLHGYMVVEVTWSLYS